MNRPADCACGKRAFSAVVTWLRPKLTFIGLPTVRPRPTGPTRFAKFPVVACRLTGTAIMVGLNYAVYLFRRIK